MYSRSFHFCHLHLLGQFFSAISYSSLLLSFLEILLIVLTKPVHSRARFDEVEKSWQVLLLLSPAECYELSLYISKWHPSSTPPLTLRNWTVIHQFYLCINEWRPKGRKFVFFEIRLKSSCGICKCPSKFWIVSFSFVSGQGETSELEHPFPGGKGAADSQPSTAI